MDALQRDLIDSLIDPDREGERPLYVFNVTVHGGAVVNIGRAPRIARDRPKPPEPDTARA